MSDMSSLKPMAMATFIYFFIISVLLLLIGGMVQWISFPSMVLKLIPLWIIYILAVLLSIVVKLICIQFNISNENAMTYLLWTLTTIMYFYAIFSERPELQFMIVIVIWSVVGLYLFQKSKNSWYLSEFYSSVFRQSVFALLFGIGAMALNSALNAYL